MGRYGGGISILVTRGFVRKENKEGICNRKITTARKVGAPEAIALQIRSEDCMVSVRCLWLCRPAESIETSARSIQKAVCAVLTEEKKRPTHGRNSTIKGRHARREAAGEVIIRAIVVVKFETVTSLQTDNNIDAAIIDTMIIDNRVARALPRPREGPRSFGNPAAACTKLGGLLRRDYAYWGRDGHLCYTAYKNRPRCHTGARGGYRFPTGTLPTLEV